MDESAVAMPLRCLVDGGLVPVVAASGAHAAARAEDVERALAAADRLHEAGTWAGLSAAERCEVLARVPEHLAAIEEQMAQADAEETGVPINVTRMIAGSLKEAFTAEALGPVEEALRPREFRNAHGPFRQLRKPWGPALVLAPWNVPSGTVAPKVIAALAAGCPVIVKPSECAPTGLELFLGAVNAAGLPPGALQWLHGGPELGAQLTSDTRVGAVHFTGSAETGAKVAAACASRLSPVAMECGGSNAALVLADADLDTASKGVAAGVTMLNGQWCAGISRLLVHESIASDFIDRVLALFGGMKVGPAADESTEIGPLSHGAHKARIDAIREGLEGRGGRARTAPPPAVLPPGNYVLPTLVEGVEGEPDAGEIFGPLATVHVFSDSAEAARKANLRPLLQCYVFGRDHEEAMRVGDRLRCGNVMVNGVGFGWEMGETLVKEPAAGLFGGSGIGVEDGVVGLLQLFAGPQNVGVNG